jgi:hypothetical protein
MPSATLEDIALRSTNPVKRAMDVMCVVLLQLLTLILLANEQDPAKRRNHPALGSHTILARLEAGENFGLPRLLVQYLRTTARQILAGLPLDDAIEHQSSLAIPTTPQHPGALHTSTNRCATGRHIPHSARRDAPDTLQTMPSRRQTVIRGRSNQSAFPAASTHALFVAIT